MTARLIAGGTIWILALTSAVLAETCNPAIHGTFCETNMGRPGSVGRSGGLQPIQNLGNDVRNPRDPPGTLGAITFQRGGGQCIGLLTRGRCN